MGQDTETGELDARRRFGHPIHKSSRFHAISHLFVCAGQQRLKPNTWCISICTTHRIISASPRVEEGKFGMQSGHEHKAELCDYVSCEAHIPNDHPLRLVRAVADEVFEMLSPQFEGCYSCPGRASIAPEKLLRSLLLQVFYTISSLHQLVEQLDYNLLFRWFVGLPIDSPRWDVAVFIKDRERLLAGDAAARFLAAVLGQPRVKALLSDEHFSPDGGLIEAWSMPNGLQSRQRSAAPELEHNTECDIYGENGEKLPYYPARRYASL